ncbi:MAG: hypothetical protein ACYTCU_00775 [Planctomycetota bacterium]
MRHELCRVAVGAAGLAGASRAASHVRHCAECGRWVDELARVRAWLGERRVNGKPPLSRAEVEARARAALSRELAARLARDLLDRARGRTLRPATERAADLMRVEALGGAYTAACRRAASLLASDGPPDRAVLLALAHRLDPLGLDVALAHLAQLERAGKRREADREADRLLELLR